ncbi:MAG: hypothetical protein JST70_09175 [Bacteroidetes bacterium]|nr:hypothetical protein [Bacteroidota bacterium]
MENLGTKATFLRNDLVKMLATIDPATKPLWGKMNPQQMVEHMSYAMRQASGKDPYTIVTAEEHLPRMQAFLMSEKPFRENTPNQLLPDEPAPAKHESMQDSLNDLQAEIDHFFHVYGTDPQKTITNPFFGELNYDMQVQLLHKHAWHHLRQFGITE